MYIFSRREVSRPVRGNMSVNWPIKRPSSIPQSDKLSVVSALQCNVKILSALSSHQHAKWCAVIEKLCQRTENLCLWFNLIIIYYYRSDIE